MYFVSLEDPAILKTPSYFHTSSRRWSFYILLIPIINFKPNLRFIPHICHCIQQVRKCFKDAQRLVILPVIVLFW